MTAAPSAAARDFVAANAPPPTSSASNAATGTV